MDFAQAVIDDHCRVEQLIVGRALWVANDDPGTFELLARAQGPLQSAQLSTVSVHGSNSRINILRWLHERHDVLSALETVASESHLGQDNQIKGRRAR